MPKTTTTFRLLALVLTLALVAAWGPAAAADTLLKMKSHTDAMEMMGQTRPAEDDEITFWIGDGRAVRSDGDTAIVLRTDQGKLYMIDHGAESYSVIDLPVDIAALLPPEMKAQMDQMLQAMEMTATVEPTDERKEINGWDTRLYRVHLQNQMGIQIDSQVWATDEIAIDSASFESMYRAIASLQPGGAAAADELLKIEGVPVLTETTIQGMGGSSSSREEVVSAETMDAPAGTYDVPEGYVEKAFNPMGGQPGG